MARKLTPEEEPTLSDVLGLGPGSDPEPTLIPEHVGQLRENTPLKLSSELEAWYGDKLGNGHHSV